MLFCVKYIFGLKHHIVYKLCDFIGPGSDEYTVMGWGRTNNNNRDKGDKDDGGAFENVLQKLSVPHIVNSWCKSNPQWKAFSKITTDRQLCAGGRFRE